MSGGVTVYSYHAKTEAKAKKDRRTNKKEHQKKCSLFSLSLVVNKPYIKKNIRVFPVFGSFPLTAWETMPPSTWYSAKCHAIRSSTGNHSKLHKINSDVDSTSKGSLKIVVKFLVSPIALLRSDYILLNLTLRGKERSSSFNYGPSS